MYIFNLITEKFNNLALGYNSYCKTTTLSNCCVRKSRKSAVKY